MKTVHSEGGKKTQRKKKKRERENQTGFLTSTTWSSQEFRPQFWILALSYFSLNQALSE
jgi:hypothetical protein